MRLNEKDKEEHKVEIMGAVLGLYSAETGVQIPDYSDEFTIPDMLLIYLAAASVMSIVAQENNGN